MPSLSWRRSWDRPRIWMWRLISYRRSTFVPLAISQAAAYIQARVPRSSAEKYLAECRESEREKSRLLQYDGGDLRRDGGASNAILITWQISFDHIRSEGPSTADLLSLMSFFDRKGIPGWVLKPSRTIKDATPTSRKISLVSPSMALPPSSDSLPGPS